jgi:hypothetical protein
MRDSKNQSAMAQYLKTNVAVVEVRNRESQEDAWRRYLSDNPESLGVRVKIFHYPRASSPNFKRPDNSGLTGTRPGLPEPRR